MSIATKGCLFSDMTIYQGMKLFTSKVLQGTNDIYSCCRYNVNHPSKQACARPAGHCEMPANNYRPVLHAETKHFRW